MNSDNLPNSQNGDYVPDFDAHDEEVLSRGNNRLLYVLAGIVLVLVLGYVALPKGTANGQSSATPSFMLDDAAVTATAPTSADSIAAGLKAAPVVAETATEESAPKETKSKTKAASARTTAEEAAALVAAAPVVAAVETAAPAPAPAPAPLVSAAPAAPTKAMATGKIIDENGHPLVGATVLLKGSSKGTSTDANGNYTLEVPGSGTDNTLIFGYGGYEDEVAHTRGSQAMNVTLTPRAKAGRKRR